MPGKYTFCRNRQIKMPRNSIFPEKYREIKMSRKFLAAKISCNKVSFAPSSYQKVKVAWDRGCPFWAFDQTKSPKKVDMKIP